MRKVRPGQIHSFNGQNVRAKKRTDGCNGCILKDTIPCLNSIIKGSKKEPVNCLVDDVIFVKP